MRLLRGNQKVYAALLALLMVVPVSFYPSSVYGLELQNRTILVQTSVPSASTNHLFTFDMLSSSVVGSVVLEYCSNSPLLTEPCTPPAGLSVLGASLAAQTGETGFSIHASTTANRMVLTRLPVAVSPQAVSYSFDNVVNPSTVAESVYVRITTHAADDGSSPVIDFGAVVFSTSGGIGVESYVPPFLIFCTGVTVAPDCSSQNGNSIDLGELTASEARSSTSQFAGATNDPLGYVVSLLGTTMTSGTNIINPLSSPAPSTPGSGQYGINLRANSNPNVGQEPAGVGTSVPSGNFNIPNQYAFSNGVLTNSSLPTEFNTFTVSYVVNVAQSQAPGVYSTTATYIATAAF